MSGVSKLAGYPVVKRLSNGILFTTVRKFKGLEGKIIILVDVTSNTFRDKIKKHIFYEGSYHAKQRI